MESDSFPVKRFNFNVTSMDGLSTEVVEMCKKDEEKMAKEDIKEFRHQEAKNMLEEQLYKYRSTVTENSEQIEEEETIPFLPL